MSAQPSKTLYINNLNDKVKKPELRAQLYQLFTPYGRVVDIVALKTAKMRGQAFVVFADQVAATTALRALGGETFYGKPLKITYSKNLSKALIPASQSTAPGSSASKIVLSTAQREADELKRSREEDDTIRERADKRARGEEVEDEPTKGEEADEDDMDMDEEDDEDAPGPKP
ncbi:hypothetical protein BDY24DRAFT_399003 [Mrakia frigida]|uniref:RNA-binding protein n=1 Tax=Mrakia frigida TaxID=29902 RepID=UPI003FCC118A